MLQSSRDEKAQILMLGTNELRDLLEQKARNGEWSCGKKLQEHSVILICHVEGGGVGAIPSSKQFFLR